MIAKVRGPRLVLSFALLVALVGGVSFYSMKTSSRLRFAVGIHAIPEAEGRRLPLDRPLLVQIERGTAGRSSLQALALVVDQNSRLLYPPTPLAVSKGPEGALREAAELPPLRTAPQRGLVSVIVMRLPKDAADPMRVQEALGKGGPLHLSYARLQRFAARHHGAAEMISTETISASAPTAAPGG